MRSRTATAIILTVAALLAGCTKSGLHEPTGPHDPWTATTADRWIVQSRGCGFCSGGLDVPEHSAFVMYAAGEVLVVRYAIGPNESAPRLDLGPDAEAYRKVLEELFTGEHLYGEGATSASDREPHKVRVHGVVTSRLTGADWAGVRSFLEESLSAARDPGPPDFSDVTDYGGERVRVHGSPSFDVVLNMFHHERDAWGGVVVQLRIVKAWVEDGAASAS